MTSLLSKLNPIPFFPSHPGPYDVGSADIEIDASVFTSNGESPLPPSHSDVATLQFRVFYPTTLKGEASKVSPAPHPVRWFPSPRREYVAAYAKFLGVGPFLANVLSYIPRNLYYIQLPVFQGHPLLKAGQAGGFDVPEKFPTVIFSHGLGGTRNTYSYLLGSIASQGCVVFALEHRDGSAATTFVRPSAHHRERSKINAEGIPETPSSSGSSTVGDESDNKKSSNSLEEGLKNLKISGNVESKRIDYVTHPHEISESTAALRNKQFELRFWELGLMFAFAQRLNKGDFDADVTPQIRIDHKSGDDVRTFLDQFKARLKVDSPGSITWAGHSFGAATITQFVKSIWYYNTTELEHLYSPTEALHEHFHPSNKETERAPTVILLDPWTLPLLGTRTRALWRLPLPGPTFCGLSDEFFVWKPNLRGNRQVLSPSGGGKNGLYAHGDHKKDDNDEEDDAEALSRQSSMDVTVEIPAGLVGDEESKAAAISHENENTPLSRTPSSSVQRPDRKFYYVTKSAHLSHSDFGVLFPSATKAMSKAEGPEETLVLNARAILEFMREQGQDIAPYKDGKNDGEIFGPDGTVARWLSVPLEQDDEAAKLEKEKEEKRKAAAKEDEGKKTSSRL